MNQHGYIDVVSPTPMKPPPLGVQDFNFRFATHVGNTNEHAMMAEKSYSPRLDGKYTALRNPCDVRSRYDTSLHDEQQRLHALYMEQLYKGANNDIRSLQMPSDVRFPVYDVRQTFPKKGIEESHAHELQKAAFESTHYSQDSKVAYQEEGRYFSQNSYPTPNLVNGKLSYNDIKRYNGGSEQQAKGTGAMVTNPSPQHISQKLNESMNGNGNVFSENVNNISYVKEEMKRDEELTVEVTNDLPIKIKKNHRENTDNFHMSIDTNSREKDQFNKDKQNEANITARSGGDGTNEDSQKDDHLEGKIKGDKDKQNSCIKSNSEKVSPTDTATDNGLPSYTAMIAQAILKKSSKSTLSDIYEYMEKTFPSLEKRGTGWRNCVRHTLSLNDCFLKLHRPENGRSCNWTIHPSYYESFSRGDYRKKRALRKRARGLQWMDPMIFNGYPALLREHEIHPDLNQQQHTLFHHSVPPPSMWAPSNGYNCTFVQTNPDHLHHFPPHPSPTATHPPPSPSGMHTPSYGAQLTHSGHFESANCTNPECYCQYNRNNCRVYSM